MRTLLKSDLVSATNKKMTSSVKRAQSVCDFRGGTSGGKYVVSSHTTGAAGDTKYSNRYDHGYGEYATDRAKQKGVARKQISCSLNKPMSIYDQPGEIRRTFSSWCQTHKTTHFQLTSYDP